MTIILKKMNEILKKRIEEAANGRYTDNTFAYKGFIYGAEYALSHQWISVKDRMPSEWQSVFILLIEKNDIKVTEAIYIGENGTWVYGDTEIPYNKNILAWMPIPKFEEILQANKDVLMRLKDM